MKKNEKEKKETKKQRIFSKEIYLLFLLVIVLIGGLGISHLLSQSYAALQPVESLPETLTSKLEMNAAAGITIPARSNYIPNISILKRFYAVDPAGTEYDIYCLDRWLVQNGGIHYVKSDTPIEDKGMAYLLSQIYPNNDDFLKGKTDDVKRYISQLTVWFYQDRKDGYSDTVDICSVPEYTNNGCKGTGDDAESDTTFYWKNSLLASEKEAIKNSEYWPTMEKIITAAANYQENNNYSITINRDEVSFEVTSDGKYMESNYISVMTTGSNFLGYTLTTNSQNVTFYDEQGKKINSGTTTSQNTKFKIRVPIETVKEAGKLSVNVDVSGSFSSKDAYFYHPEDSSFQRALMGAMQLNPIRRGVNLAIEYPMGSVKISKVDATTGEELAGATLVVKDANGTEIDRWVSTNEPHYIDPIKAGTYTLTEIYAPDGYVLSKQTITFTVTARNVTEVEMVNQTIGKVEISKKDITDNKELPGATLVIKNMQGQEVKRFVSTNEPHTFSLEDGTYTLTEIIAPKGYVLSEETITFTVQAGRTTKIEMKNTPLGKVEISKKDITNNKELPGATLTIKDMQGNVVTDLDGNPATWVSTNKPHTFSLPDGTYTLTEIIAPKGYALSKETITFTVQAGRTTKIEMKNTPLGKAKISKTDLVTGKEVAGATLVITDKDGTEIARFVSTDEPYYIDALEDGTYTLTEIIAPKGYVLNEETVTFTVQAGKTTVVEMKNEPYGIVEIEKIDATTGNTLIGAKLVISDKDGAEIARFVSTDEPYVIALPKGTYTLTEVEAPEGYALNQTGIDFEVRAGELIQVEMQNMPKVDVPNTASSFPTYIYIIGGILFLLGGSFIGFSLTKKESLSK